jgi:hypothetical protein
MGPIGGAVRRSAAAISIAAAALLAGGCGGDVSALVNGRTVNLNAAQVSATNTSTATGTASVVVSSDRQSITVITRTTGLGTITGAHIHAGLTGTSGLMRVESPIIFSLFDSTQLGSNGEITRTLASPNLTAQASVGISTFADAVNAILAGRAYIDFHTTAYPTGEIRGQILPATFTAQLSGANEVPPNTLTATGNATLTIDPSNCTLGVTVSTAGLDNSTVTGIDIQVGASDENGPVIFAVFAVPQGPFTGSFSRTLTATDLVVQSGAGILTCFDAINAVITGDAYVNVRTLTNPNGAIRGQFKPTVSQ